MQAALGGTVAWHAEVDPAAARVLAYRHPDVPNLGDLTGVDWNQVEPVDVLTAGYPCQPFSHTGLRKGTSDVRHIWPHIADAVRVLRPGLFVGENVSGHLSLGFGRVLCDLSAIGYVGQWGCLRAADVGAPHGRNRVFIVACPAADTDSSGAGWDGSSVPSALAEVGRPGRRVHPPRAAGGVDWGQYEPAIRRWEGVLGRPAPPPTEPGAKGQPRLSPRFVEFLMGVPDGWVTDVPGVSRSAQLKILGNGCVPQQVEAAVWMLLGAGLAVAV